MKTKKCEAALLLMCLCSAGGAAEAAVNWLRLGDSAQAEIYIDTAGVERPPGYVKAWTLLSYKSPQAGGWRSERRLFMYSCEERRLDWQQSVYQAQAMGEGAYIHSRSLNRYGIRDLRLVELDPASKDPEIYKKAVPESAFVSVFKDLC